jgi:hypothetical protein
LKRKTLFCLTTAVPVEACHVGLEGQLPRRRIHGVAATLITKGEEVKFDVEYKLSFQLTEKLEIAPR